MKPYIMECAETVQLFIRKFFSNNRIRKMAVVIANDLIIKHVSVAPFHEISKMKSIKNCDLLHINDFAAQVGLTYSHSS